MCQRTTQRFGWPVRIKANHCSASADNSGRFWSAIGQKWPANPVNLVYRVGERRSHNRLECNRKYVEMQQPTIIARAFELARGGTCPTSTAIRSILMREGYEHVHQHLMAPSVVRQLKKLIKEAALPLAS
jgi:hypothetical protein